MQYLKREIKTEYYYMCKRINKSCTIYFNEN